MGEGPHDVLMNNNIEARGKLPVQFMGYSSSNKLEKTQGAESLIQSMYMSYIHAYIQHNIYIH